MQNKRYNKANLVWRFLDADSFKIILILDTPVKFLENSSLILKGTRIKKSKINKSV